METVNVSILRYDPAAEYAPKLEDFKVPFWEDMHVYDALEYIYEKIDHSLAFRCSCRISNCEICLIMANGKTIYLCQEKLTDGMILEPLSGFEVVRDLVVDFNKRVGKRDR